ncbi:MULTISPECIES: HAD-IB family phosphatase [unclassified Streptomyces]|uniref:HAD family hydrolase n=1 Tax=unclassified Streptomyces TaxID=2593676 RepID=UPI002DD8F2C1|nr:MULTISPECIES: HAD-IB family phosphatase [unclassified Streptomyces]WSA93673.1 HAD-IB family phosphatase [Streptomyces sp. NBC_01795]WSB78045.1 HAD-IB family phosphatase [Streptomyces sp. NBC_01775]WSS13703.1 HAD-IB family phosphatase [Streptomyces sp. NBC_01186]WSS42525.1 HAD-IB family phosphatase [Streptomyces sp. NBC_01187]
MAPADDRHQAPSQSRPRPRLHLFDLDGTLMYGSAAAVEISQQLGVEREIRALERAFAARELSPPQYAERACALWSGLTDQVVAAAFAGAPWLAGIREVWAEIRANGDHCAVISLSPDFFVRGLLDWGAHAAHGSRWPEVPSAIPNGSTKYPSRPMDPTGILTPAAKVKVAQKLCAQFGVLPQDCVAYGDSLSDTELFAAVPVSVAVNADHHVRTLASHAYTGRDLRGAYQFVSVTR